MASVETVECSNCGAPLPAEQEVCQYCGSRLIVKRDTEPLPAKAPSSRRKFPSLGDTPRVEQKKKEPASGCATAFSFLVGAFSASVSIIASLDKTKTGTGAIALFSTPVAMVCLWFSLVNWFPKLRGWGMLLAGIVIGATTYFSLWTFFSQFFLGYVLMGVLFLIALVLVVFGISDLIPSYDPEVPIEQINEWIANQQKKSPPS